VYHRCITYTLYIYSYMNCIHPISCGISLIVALSRDTPGLWSLRGGAESAGGQEAAGGPSTPWIRGESSFSRKNGHNCGVYPIFRHTLLTLDYKAHTHKNTINNRLCGQGYFFTGSVGLLGWNQHEGLYNFEKQNAFWRIRHVSLCACKWETSPQRLKLG